MIKISTANQVLLILSAIGSFILWYVFDGSMFVFLLITSSVIFVLLINIFAKFKASSKIESLLKDKNEQESIEILIDNGLTLEEAKLAYLKINSASINDSNA